jgi:CheY-like chemotaxis protein
MASTFRILLVEDDDLDAMNVRRALRGVPAVESVTVVPDGVEALELLRSGRIPLDRLVLLIDLRMPRMSGLELLAALRAIPPLASLPAVILTTSADARDRASAYALHVAGYLLKPLDGTAFRECMQRFAAYWSNMEHPPAEKVMS